MSDWKPGTVALVEGKVAFWVDGAYNTRDPFWQWGHGGWTTLPLGPVRPLVVLDPENREQVERLAVAYDAQLQAAFPDEYRTWADLDVNADNNLMQAALREYANPTPPKPDEPTGQGAVVEDAEGQRWVRVGDGLGDAWRRTGVRCASDGIDGWTLYADISAVRVLSEGVQP